MTKIIIFRNKQRQRQAEAITEHKQKNEMIISTIEKRLTGMVSALTFESEDELKRYKEAKREKPNEVHIVKKNIERGKIIKYGYREDKKIFK